MNTFLHRQEQTPQENQMKSRNREHSVQRALENLPASVTPILIFTSTTYIHILFKTETFKKITFCHSQEKEDLKTVLSSEKVVSH